ncbi:MAG: hypothetical protein GX437_03540 [Sphingobacteriales bacterium]|nr:hypothetical protein [Sphingobacteriales bacterium]
MDYTLINKYAIRKVIDFQHIKKTKLKQQNSNWELILKMKKQNSDEF